MDFEHGTPGTAVPIEWFTFATRKSIEVGLIRKPVLFRQPSLSVTRDGRWIAWAQVDRAQSDLVLIENFR